MHCCMKRKCLRFNSSFERDQSLYLITQTVLECQNVLSTFKLKNVELDYKAVNCKIVTPGSLNNNENNKYVGK